jgi:hypothetical protein
VEITPEREYLLVTEFFFGAIEIGDAVIDDDVIDQGLLLVRSRELRAFLRPLRAAG